jgi:hypothetical protein
MVDSLTKLFVLLFKHSERIEFIVHVHEFGIHIKLV